MPSSHTSFRQLRPIFEGLTSFAQFENRVRKLPNTKLLGDAFEILVQAFLLTQKSQQAKRVWLVGQVPLRIRKKHNLPNGSDGIDGVYETVSGEVIPYQVKWRDNNYLGFAETGTFFAATDRASIKHRVIFTNVDDFAENIKKRDGVRFVRGHHFKRLTEEDFQRITAWLFQEPVRYKPLTLRAHQKTATKAIRAEFKGANRATVVMACGTGKTLVGIDVGQEARRKVVFVPSLALMSQTIDVWCRELGDRMPPFISVCSDKTVNRDSQNDSFVDVATDVDFQVSTNTEEVKEFLGRTKECVLFSTYHSAPVVGRAMNGYAFDLGIFDEAHRTVGISASRFAFALHDKNIKIRKRLFMTATPRQIRKVRRSKDYKYVDMDDTAVYGKRVYRMTFKQAVKAGIICPYKIVITCLTNADITRKKMRKGITLVRGDPAGTYRIANALAVQQAIKKVGAKKVIAFLSRISKAKEFVADDDPHSIGNFLSANWELFSVSSQMNAKDREDTLADFKDACRSLISNARCLTEGVDLPAVDAVCFIDPKQSRIEIAQAVGRAMRKAPGKKCGYIVVPIFQEQGEGVRAAFSNAEFEKVRLVLHAMMEHDEDLIDLVKALRAGELRSLNSRVLKDKIAFIGTRVSLPKLKKSITTEIVNDYIRGSNWRAFEEARAYVRAQGFRTMREWRIWNASDKRPYDIPSTPQVAYKGQGWKNFVDWIGNRGRPKPSNNNWLPFEEARKIVRGQHLKNYLGWQRWCKTERPTNIPSSPRQIYTKEWQGMSDWIGSRRTRNWRTFEQARELARKLKFTKVGDWLAWRRNGKNPVDVPAYPYVVYAKQWQGWADFFGCPPARFQRGNWRSHLKAMKFVRSLGLRSHTEYRSWARSDKRPRDIPTAPHRVYGKKGWVSWPHFLGTRRPDSGHKWKAFINARAFIRSRCLASQHEYQALMKSQKRPRDIPTNPHTTYRGKGWTNWPDWLGNGNTPKKVDWPGFKKARAFVRSRRLRTVAEYRNWMRSSEPKEAFIPTAPHQVYREWTDWGDWLGTGRRHRQYKKLTSFKKARALVRSRRFRTRVEYLNWLRSSEGQQVSIPYFPNRVYKEWTDWGDWLGDSLCSVSVVRLGQTRSIRDERVRRLRMMLQTKPRDGSTHWTVQAAARESGIPRSSVQRYFKLSASNLTATQRSPRATGAIRKRGFRSRYGQ